MPVTLILTRNPLKTFVHRTWDDRVNRMVDQSGRWGELIAVKGPKVTSVRLSSKPDSTNKNGSKAIPIGNGTVQLSTTGEGEFSEVKRFTSIERFKADSGAGYYVQLHPKPDPYWITHEVGNSAVKHLRPGHDGQCLRVHGGKRGPEQGILIHEAPHVGWVIGCISPRPLNNFTIAFHNNSGNPSAQAMKELFGFVGADRADFFVMDW